MKEEVLDEVLYELEQAENIEIDTQATGEISFMFGGLSSLICC